MILEATLLGVIILVILFTWFGSTHGYEPTKKYSHTWGATHDQVVDILNHVIQLLQNGFTQDEIARDDRGNPVRAVSPIACSWSLPGALTKAIIESPVDNRISEELVFCLIRSMGDYRPPNPERELFTFNNTHSKEEVINLVRKTRNTELY